MQNDIFHIFLHYNQRAYKIFLIQTNLVNTSVGSEPKLGSVLARAFGQKSSAWLAMPFKKLGSPYLAKELGSAQLAL